MSLIYSVRTATDVIYADELGEDVALAFTREPPAGWTGHTGRIDASMFDAGTAYAAVKRMLLGDLSPHLFRTRDFGKTWTKITTGLKPNDITHTIREDRKRRYMLYAGTEHGVYYSYDDGDHWHSLSLNLPDTQVSDLWVEDTDLAISTMGRSFWVLDDIGPLRQMAAAGTQLTLLRPSSRIRYRRAGGGRGAAPQYPAVALAIDYLVPEGFSGPLTLTISDAQGRNVRTVDSTAAGQRGQGRAATVPGARVDPDMAPPGGRGRGAAPAGAFVPPFLLCAVCVALRCFSRSSFGCSSSTTSPASNPSWISAKNKSETPTRTDRRSYSPVSMSST